MRSKLKVVCVEVLEEWLSCWECRGFGWKRGKVRGVCVCVCWPGTWRKTRIKNWRTKWSALNTTLSSSDYSFCDSFVFLVENKIPMGARNGVWELFCLRLKHKTVHVQKKWHTVCCRCDLLGRLCGNQFHFRSWLFALQKNLHWLFLDSPRGEKQHSFTLLSLLSLLSCINLNQVTVW